jgi:hypothetical protein
MRFVVNVPLGSRKKRAMQYNINQTIGLYIPQTPTYKMFVLLSRKLAVRYYFRFVST